MSGALSGLKVVDLSNNVLGPLATQMLGDMGADVIKVEAPAGDPIRYSGASHSPDMAAFFLNLNRNKRSIALDLKRPAAREALGRLVSTADVFVHSMRRGAAARLGIDYASLSADNPGLVYAVGGGFNRNGPRKDRPAFDDVIQGESGIAALNAHLSGKPDYVPMVIVDKVCGMALGSAIAIALVHRARTGRGQQVHLPMFETMVAFNMIEHMWEATRGAPARGVGYPRLLTRHRRPYETSDGHICLMASTNAQWLRLYGVLARPDLAEDPRFRDRRSRTVHVDALYGIVADAMRQRPTNEWQQRLDAADIPNGKVNTPGELACDPYLHDTGFFTKVEHPSEGSLVLMSNPTSLSETPPSLRLLPPRLGEHTDAVLKEIGYTGAQIEDIEG